MENKYYTPEISDIRIDYECEIYSEFQNRGFEWLKLRLIPNSVKAILEDNIKIERIRVSYLTKEQIEAEGWKLIEEKNLSKDKSVLKFKKDTRILYQGYLEDYTVVRELIQIWNNEKENHCIFEGKCSSINEFKIICKLLGIK